MKPLNAQELSPEAVVQKQLDAYNRRHIDDFMAVMDDEVTLTNFNDGRQLAKGAAEVRKMYQELFDLSPKLHSTIVKRITFANKVIDHESIVGRRGVDAPIELVVVFEVKSGKIVKMTVIRE